MKNLTKDDLHSALTWIDKNGRELEKALVNFYYHNGDATRVLTELKKFQNEDGGFGHGLEPDFRLPNSTPLATTIAFQELFHHDNHPLAIEMIEQGISYFERTYIPERKGWLAVTPELNEYPHAIWWHVNEVGESSIDAHWGNPSAEIIGYLLRYKDYVKKLNINELVTYSLEHLMSLSSYESEHEIYCYIRFFELHTSLLTSNYEAKLKEAVDSLVHYDRSAWEKYVPSPLKFISTANSPFYGIEAAYIKDNVDYLIDKITSNGYIQPNWAWPQYPETWELAKKEWSGILTLAYLKQIESFKELT